MVTRLDINVEVLLHYVKQSEAPVKKLQDKVSSFDKVMSGEKKPTFNQLSEIAKIINVPTGLLMLPKAIDVENNRLAFRTLNSRNLEGMSAELKDTILEMEVKQDFLKSEISDELGFIGEFTINDDYLEVANSIREYLNISTDYYKSIKDNPLNFFRERINALGIFVFFNGKIKDNTHRPLDINEFRGFVLTDKVAPIIFINQRDSRTGQLFTLIHELVHLFLNIDDIFNVIETDTYQFDPTEAFVNKVTAEILVPETELIEDKLTDFEALSRKFNVSQFVIVRRLLDLNYISKKEYTKLTSDLERQFKNIPSKKTTTGGNYNNNLKFRLDKVFFRYVDNAVKQNKITYTEAFNILGVGYKGYKTLREGKN